MEYGICDLSILPVRAEPSDKSEIVSQLLFGESYTMLSKKSNWAKIEMNYDGYEGWISEKQHNHISEVYYQKIKTEKPAIALELVNSATSMERQIPIVIGSSLPEFDGMNFKVKKEKFVYNGQALSPGNGVEVEKIIEKSSLKYLNAPYLWGGRSPFGIDCSGFTQCIFKIAGIKLKRDAYLQAESGKTIDFIEQSKIGDLAFFENAEGKIMHVGIILRDNRIIHASGKVRIDKIDHYGIFDERNRKYSHKLRLIKRIL